MDAIAARKLLLDMARAAVDAASPARCVPPHLPTPPKGRTIVIGAGKAAASMAKAVEDAWQGPLSGLVVTRYGHGMPCRFVEVVEASHPVPDEAGQRAASRMLEMVGGLTQDDLVLCLISGGGSALLSLPAEGLTLADKQAINRALLRSGATISEMNTVRKHLSRIKGGQLALACAPARVVTLIISDVPGDDPAIVASGPTVADASTFQDASAILDKYRINEPRAVIEHLHSARHETPKPGDPRLANHALHIVASARMALDAAAQIAKSHGIEAHILGDDIEGEARELAAQHGERAQLIYLRPTIKRPCVLLSGGETTVTMTGNGRGGRNSEYLLALACTLKRHAGIHALAIDTDGIDGSEDNAGAVIAPDTLARATALGLNAESYLNRNDAYGFFSALDDLVITGPTRTNVNDFRAILVT